MCEYIQSVIDAAYAAGEPADLGPDRPGPIVDCRGGTIATEDGRLVYYPPEGPDKRWTAGPSPIEDHDSYFLWGGPGPMLKPEDW